MAKKTLFDPQCYELAKLFLEGTPGEKSETDRESLAATIQDTIEDWLNQKQQETDWVTR